jgi:lipoate-protein ligase A
MVNRLIVDAPASGAWNMAVDEALFQSASSDGGLVLRLYQWSEPTLSLGYFQRAAERDLHVASRDLPLVRRSTGGGAIIHDHELTYSLIAQLPNERPSGPRLMMARVHESLVGLLVEMHIPARICDNSTEDRDEPFLCFSRHTAGDILVGKDKVVGSAQRRQRRILLQHGSILLRRSLGAPELPGINDLAAESGCSVEALIEAWPKRLHDLISGPWTTSQLTVDERELAGKIELERFENQRWNLKR